MNILYELGKFLLSEIVDSILFWDWILSLKTLISFVFKSYLGPNFISIFLPLLCLQNISSFDSSLHSKSPLSFHLDCSLTPSLVLCNLVKQRNSSYITFAVPYFPAPFQLIRACKWVLHNRLCTRVTYFTSGPMHRKNSKEICKWSFSLPTMLPLHETQAISDMEMTRWIRAHHSKLQP